MEVLPLQFELIEFQGFLTVAVYMHYFSPESMKSHTDVAFVSPEEFEDLFSGSELNTRRWNPAAEYPYPGYCRTPGSSLCQPILCNCQKLDEIWIKIQSTKSEKKPKL